MSLVRDFVDLKMVFEVMGALRPNVGGRWSAGREVLERKGCRDMEDLEYIYTITIIIIYNGFFLVVIQRQEA